MGREGRDSGKRDFERDIGEINEGRCEQWGKGFVLAGSFDQKLFTTSLSINLPSHVCG